MSDEPNEPGGEILTLVLPTPVDDSDEEITEYVINQEAVALLEELLEDARAGNITEVMAIFRRPVGYCGDDDIDQRVVSRWTSALDSVQRIGLIEHMKITWSIEAVELMRRYFEE